MLKGTANRPVRSKQRLGKYRIERKLGEGGFAAVYEATDTIEGLRVALKIPFGHLLTEEVLEDFRREVRLAARLNHPHILPLKNADFIEGHFVLALPLGERTLADRLQSRMSLATSLDFAGQMLGAVAYAHEHRIIHCDIKPENLILFPDGRLMLTDFGIAKVALNTIRASGSGTVGYIAPEQAMGKPSFRSDVFSLGLVLYRMFSGTLPEWPYDWPPAGYERIRRLHPDLVQLIRRAMSLDPRRRFSDAGRMLAALQRVKSRALRAGTSRQGRSNHSKSRDWRTVQRLQFVRTYGKQLGAKHSCPKCEGPIAPSMSHCPWCGVPRPVHRGSVDFPQHCPRCRRGLKADWRFCPWCYGPGFDVAGKRQYSDRRYTAKCSNPGCTRKRLMPFMRYCPWCRRKVSRRWKIEGSDDKCPSCKWGVIKAFWSYCPWCGQTLAKTRKR
jgi:serine/threonine-protein kinase